VIAHLATSITIYLHLNIGKVKVFPREKVFMNLLSSIYLGWISIVIIANMAMTLTYVGWDGWSIQLVNCNVIVIAMVLILSLVVLTTRRDIAYTLIII
jgi:hypothetical protein